MSDIKGAFGLLFDTFTEYAGDEREDNTLTKSEFIDLLTNEFGDAPKDKPDVEELFSQLDGDRDGVVTFNEFVTTVASFDRVHTNESRLTEAMALLKSKFEKYARYEGDSDTLTRRDLRFLMYKEFPDSPRDKDAMDIAFSKADADGDGVVTFEEFLITTGDFYTAIGKE